LSGIGRAAFPQPGLAVEGERDSALITFDTAADPRARENFLRWTQEHAGAYFVNAKSPARLMLHRADCGHLAFESYDAVDLARSRKVCSADRAELEQWSFLNSDSPLQVCRDCLPEPLTLFSWGYEGWGNATAQLDQAVTAVEAARGFQPPLFVDTRIHRSVRAVGFVNNALASVVGPARYEHWKGLGNQAVAAGDREAIVIAAPEQAGDLLARASQAARERRRLIFFCHCKDPSACHRHVVADLVAQAARRQGVAAQVVEWPGSLPLVRSLRVASDILVKVKRGRKSIPLGRELPEVGWLGLPWGSVVRLEAPGGEWFVVSGPAGYTSGMWVLPVLGVPGSPRESMSDLKSRAWAWRLDNGYHSRRA
jgi:hypothetical protein